VVVQAPCHLKILPKPVQILCLLPKVTLRTHQLGEVLHDVWQAMEEGEEKKKLEENIF
jgi:hypothetical protein